MSAYQLWRVHNSFPPSTNQLRKLLYLPRYIYIFIMIFSFTGILKIPSIVKVQQVVIRPVKYLRRKRFWLAVQLGAVTGPRVSKQERGPQGWHTGPRAKGQTCFLLATFRWRIPNPFCSWRYAIFNTAHTGFKKKRKIARKIKYKIMSELKFWHSFPKRCGVKFQGSGRDSVFFIFFILFLFRF